MGILDQRALEDIPETRDREHRGVLDCLNIAGAGGWTGDSCTEGGTDCVLHDKYKVVNRVAFC